MARRLFVAVALASCVIVSGTARDASAQERVATANIDLTPVFQNAEFPLAATQPIRLLDVEQRQSPITRAPVDRSRTFLGSLYVSTALMQGLDVHSTLRALDRGAVEANPLMSGVTRNRAAFIVTKAAVAASTILASRQMAKRNKVAAIVTLVAINSAYAMVVKHNYSVARGR